MVSPPEGLIPRIVLLPIAPLRCSMGYYLSPISWVLLYAVPDPHIVFFRAGTRPAPTLPHNDFGTVRN